MKFRFLFPATALLSSVVPCAHSDVILNGEEQTYQNNETYTGEKLVLTSASTLNVIGGAVVTITSATSGVDNLIIGGDASGTARSVLNVGSGGVMNVLNATIAVGNTTYGRGTINVNEGGTLNAKGINLNSYYAYLYIEGGTLALGSNGLSMNTLAARPASYLPKAYFNSGTIIFTETAAYSLSANHTDNVNGHFTLGNAEGTSRTFEVVSGATGSLRGVLKGEGGFRKTGEGILLLDVDNNLFTGAIDIVGGTLGAKSVSSLGQGSLITFSGDSELIISDGEEVSQDINITSGTATLWTRKDYNTSGSLTDSVMDYTGRISLSGNASLRVEHANLTFRSGQVITGNEFVTQAGTTINVDGADVTFSTSTDGFASLGLGANGNFGTSASPLTDVFTDTLNITNGGSFTAASAVISVSRGSNSGVINLSGGSATFKGILMDGLGSRISIFDSTLTLGSDGITNNVDGRSNMADIGTIQFQSGKIHFTETASYIQTGAASTHDATGYITLGTAPGERVIEVDTARYATIAGVINGSGGFTKTGNGTLLLSAANTFTGPVDLQGGIIDLGSSGSMTIASLKMQNGTSLIGDWTDSYAFTGSLTVTGNSSTTAAYWGGRLTLSDLTFATGDAMLQVNGNLAVNGDITINMTTSSAEMGPVIALTGSNILTLTSGSQIYLNTVNAALDNVGEGLIRLQIVNTTALAGLTGFDPDTDIIWNRSDEKYVFETEYFMTQGYVSWYNSALSMDLFSVARANSTDPYSPRDATVYIGAQTNNVVYNINKAYNSPDGNTRLTNGYGDFIFQPAVAGTGNLYAMGMKNGSGRVILSNNDNSQQATYITDVTLVVDSSRGISPIMPDSGTVGILGTGPVTLYGSSDYAATLELRTGGDTLRGGSYQIANSIALNENTNILQTGANSHTLTGLITLSDYATATIRNESTQDLIIRTSVSGNSAASLRFEAVSGRIILDGGASTFGRAAGNSLTIDQLNIQGGNALVLDNGYTVTTQRVNLTSDALLALEGGSVLNLGSGGMTTGTSFSMGDATLNTQGSSSVGALLTLTGNAQVNTSGNDTLVLERGITGTGNLSKTGTGSLIIARNSPSTTGTLTVYAGALQLGLNTGTILADGTTTTTTGYALAGNLDMQGGTLSGSIDAGGNAIHFGSSSVFSLAIDTTYLTSTISNAGDITVDQGATLLVNVLEQGWAVDTDYFIISSNSSIAGAEFQLALDGEFAFVNVDMTQTEKNVKLRLSAKLPEMNPETHNQAAVLNVVTPLVFEALEGRRGELRAELLNMMQIVSKMREDQLHEFVSETALSSASLYTALAGQVINTSQHVKSVRNKVVNLDPELFDKYTMSDNRNIWVEGISHYNDIDSDANAMGYRLETWGANMGVSFSLGSAAYFGVGFGYMSAEARSKGSYGENTTDSYNMDLFGRYKKDNFSLSAVVTGGFSHVDYKRFMAFDGERLRASGKSNGSQVMGMIEAAYDIRMDREGSHILQPLVNVTTGYARFRGFDESGDLGNAGYHVNAQDITPTTIGAGVRYVYTRLDTGSYTPLRGEIRAMVTQDVGDVTYNVTANYLGAPAYRMNLTGVPVERTAFIIGASGSLPLSLHSSLFADVTGEFRDNQNGLSASIGLNFMF